MADKCFSNQVQTIDVSYYIQMYLKEHLWNYYDYLMRKLCLCRNGTITGKGMFLGEAVEGGDQNFQKSQQNLIRFQSLGPSRKGGLQAPPGRGAFQCLYRVLFFFFFSIFSTIFSTKASNQIKTWIDGSHLGIAQHTLTLCNTPGHTVKKQTFSGSNLP